MNELIPSQGELAMEIGETTETAWIAPANMTYEEYERVGRTLQQVGRSLNWWIGDWLNYGERKFGEMYAQALEITGLSLESLTKYKAVAARIAPEIRIPNLSWTHHFSVAYADEHLRGPLLQMAYHFGISSRDLKALMRLSTHQLVVLINDCDAGEIEDITDFQRRVNQIRLSVPEKPAAMVNGTHMRDFSATTPKLDDEDEEEPAAPAYQQPRLVADEQEEEEVYIEEVIEFFDSEGAKMQLCTRSEAVWDGLFVMAAVDKKGRPYLHWGKPGGRKD